MISQFYINSIDDEFAKIFLESPSAKNLQISFENTTGIITIKDVSKSKKELSEGFDFELSTSECCGLNDIELKDYLGKTVHTSSALELFDFIFSFCSEVDFDIELKDGAWKVSLNSYE